MTVSDADFERGVARVRSEALERTDGARAGVYGPDSLAWRVSRESVLFLGGGCAALLQLAHPFVAHAIDQHSETESDPLGRFQRTFFHVYQIIFGDLDHAITSAERVHRIHKRIEGTLHEPCGRWSTGEPYAALDPDALFWVHATLVETSLRIFDRTVSALSGEVRDRYVLETNAFARLFGVPESLLPTSYSELSARMEGMVASKTITVTTVARTIARSLLRPPSRLYGPISHWYAFMTAGLLPASVREAYGFAWSPSHELWFERSLDAIAASYKRLPRAVREIPAYRDAMRRLGRAPPPSRLEPWLEPLTFFGLLQTVARAKSSRTKS